MNATALPWTAEFAWKGSGWRGQPKVFSGYAKAWETSKNEYVTGEHGPFTKAQNAHAHDGL